jgi:hypothetical protein
MGTSLITKSLGYMRISEAFGTDTSASQTYGVVPQCFHRSLNHFRGRMAAIHNLGLSTKWEGGELGWELLSISYIYKT